MNAAQIEKLKRKVAVEVSAKLKKRDVEIQAKQDAIRRVIELIQKENPDRGVCIASNQGIVYFILDGKLVNAGVSLSDEFELMEVSGKNTPDVTRYWMLKPEILKEHNALINWFKDNYAAIKIAVAQLKLKPGDLFTSYQLGTLSTEFRQKFPGKSMLDFIQCFRAVDKIFLESLQKNS